MPLLQIQQAHQGTAVGKEIVNDQHMVFRGEELFGDDHIVDLFVGEGLDLGLVVVVVQIDAHGLFGKHHRHVELTGHNGGNADAAGLDGEHLVDGLARKQALPLPGHLAEQRDIHLMVDKAVNLEHIPFAHNAVCADTIFQHLHKQSLSSSLFPFRGTKLCPQPVCILPSITEVPAFGKWLCAQI